MTRSAIPARSLNWRSDSHLLDRPDSVGAQPGGRHWVAEHEIVSFPAPSEPTTASSVYPPLGQHPDFFHPLPSTRDPSTNLATLAAPPPGTGTGGLDTLAAPQPLNSRRPGAPTLPSFELPAPNFQLSSSASKSPPPPGVNPATSTSVGNLLTPPATNPAIDHSNLRQPSAAVATSSDLPPSYAPAYWQGQHPLPRQPWPPAINASYAPRVAFTPLNSLGRGQATSSPVSEGMSQPYDINQLPPFHQQPSVHSPGVPTSAVPQQRVMTHTMLGTQSAPANPASPHPLASNDPYGTKSQQTPIYGGAPQQIPSPHQAYPPPPPSYPQHGLGIQPPGRTPPGPPNQPSPAGQASHLHYHRQPYPSYSLPAMSGPVMTNVHSPNSPMSLMGGMQPGLVPGFNSGHVATMQHLYGGHPPPTGHGQPGGPPNDRPFKCDQCPQSFNRNHDLKRHKRIHLSIKPYPCDYCEKSFSRKDALKVGTYPTLPLFHILRPTTNGPVSDIY